METLTKDCIHCGKCTRKCSFLQKYSLDLQELARHPELAYHCFLCGQCTRVCPKGIDGREVALTLRRNRVQEAGGKVPEKGYAALLAEKKNYLFRNARKAHKKSVLFPGCNFPSFYPKTTAYLAELLAKKADMGVLFDCCGKPIAELGLNEEEGLTALKQRLSSYAQLHAELREMAACLSETKGTSAEANRRIGQPWYNSSTKFGQPIR